MTLNDSVDDRIAVKRRPFVRSMGLGLGSLAILPGAVGARRAGSDHLSRELAEVRAGTRVYRDVATARADGFDVQISPYVPNMGFHFVNPALFAPDEHTPVPLADPPILVYYTTGAYNPAPGSPHDPDRDDDLRLGAVEFAHGGTIGVPGDLFADETASRQLAVSEADGWEPLPGTPFMALHVWVHRGNPAGVFHPSNPTVA